MLIAVLPAWEMLSHLYQDLRLTLVAPHAVVGLSHSVYRWREAHAFDQATSYIWFSYVIDERSANREAEYRFLRDGVELARGTVARTGYLLERPDGSRPEMGLYRDCGDVFCGLRIYHHPPNGGVSLEPHQGLCRIHIGPLGPSPPPFHQPAPWVVEAYDAEGALLGRHAYDALAVPAPESLRPEDFPPFEATWNDRLAGQGLVPAGTEGRLVIDWLDSNGQWRDRRHVPLRGSGPWAEAFAIPAEAVAARLQFVVLDLAARREFQQKVEIDRADDPTALCVRAGGWRPLGTKPKERDPVP